MSLRRNSMCRVCGVGLILVLGLFVVICIFVRRPVKAPVPEVSRDALVLVDGRLVLKGQTNPFTGLMSERNESGGLRSRSSVSNGVLHGLSEGWYANGRLQIREQFASGVSHGVRTKWHEKGGKFSEVMVVQGKLEGTFKRWNEDGSLCEVIEMRDGEPDGMSRAYYPNGFLKAEVRLEQGRVVESKFWDDGEQTPAGLEMGNGKGCANGRCGTNCTF